MTEMTPLHEALLELGLEDWIPLPEIRATPEIRTVVAGDQATEEISAALVDLLLEGRIQVWSGHWPDEPKPVDTKNAEEILRDEHRYSFEAEGEGLERAYFVNVDNFRG